MKKVFSLFLAMALCLSCFSITAFAADVIDSGTCGEELTWELTDDGTLTISGTGTMTDYTNSQKAPWYSYCSDITSSVVEEGVTSIGNRAFRDCSSLTGISLPDSVTSIGDRAFRDCSSLTGISLPDSVTNIDNQAFSGCSSLTSISLPDSGTSIGDQAFSGCSSLTYISLPDSLTNIP